MGYLLTGFVSGGLMIGFAEIINLLYKQAKIQRRILKALEKDLDEEEYLLTPKKDDLSI